jgi:HEAT repeat protein
MRNLILAMAALVIAGVLAGDLRAHGGTYTGPAGGATPGYNGPVGGGTGQPGPGNPNPGGGGTTPAPGGTTPAPSPGGTPVRPGGPPNLGGGNARGLGGVTGAPGAKKSEAPRFLSWDWWWDLNEERFLNLKRTVRSSADATENVDEILGGVTGGDDVAAVSAQMIRNEILPSLKQSLKDSYYDARAAGVIALGKVAANSDDDAMEAIKALLADSDARVRESACLGLGILGNKAALPLLLDVAKNTGEGRRLTGRGTSDVLTRTRAFASVAIGLIGSREDLPAEVVKELVAMASKSESNRDLQVGPAVAMQLLKRQDVVPALVSIFSDAEQDEYVRAHIGVAFGKMGAKSAIPTLKKFLGDRSVLVSYSCAIGLGLLTDPEDNDTITELLRTAKNGRDVGTRNFALMALAEIGGPKARAYIIEELTTAKSAEAKAFGAIAAGVTGYLHKEDVNLLGRNLVQEFGNEKNPQSKSAMAIALGLLGYEPGKTAIRAALKDTSNPMLQGYLCTALGLLGDQDAIPEIQNLVAQRGDADLRKNAAIALGLLRDREAVTLLKKVIEESAASKAILGAATVAMGYIGDRAAVEILRDFVENPKGTHQDVTRAFAVVALGFLGDKDDIPLLSRIHENSNYLAQSEALAELLSIL